jgi:hypothetical protein
VARFDIMGNVAGPLSLLPTVRGEKALYDLYGATLFPLVKPGSE